MTPHNIQWSSREGQFELRFDGDPETIVRAPNRETLEQLVEYIESGAPLKAVATFFRRRRRQAARLKKEVAT
jgi:hypothetical protein